MAMLARFVRSVRPDHLVEHLTGLTSAPPAISTEDDQFESKVLEYIQDLERRQRDQLLAEAERVGEMTDEVGQAALLAMTEWRPRLLAIESAYERAHWLYLNSAEAFRHAEEIRYADRIKMLAASGTRLLHPGYFRCAPTKRLG
jgi:hypothetical protein